MKILPLVLSFSLIASAVPAKNNGNQGSTAHRNPSNGFCPPGLAKKSPACIPPGLAKKYLPGSYLPEDGYDWLFDLSGLELPELEPGEAYVQIGDIILKIDRETKEIIDLFDALAKVLN